MCPWGKCPGGTCPGGFCPVTLKHNASPCILVSFLYVYFIFSPFLFGFKGRVRSCPHTHSPRIRPKVFSITKLQSCYLFCPGPGYESPTGFTCSRYGCEVGGVCRTVAGTGQLACICPPYATGNRCEKGRSDYIASYEP